MPIFEYRCSSCGSEFEALVLRTTAPPECPACHGQALVRLISLSAVSSEHTRRNALSSLQERNRALRTEHSQAEHARFHDHDHDH